MAGMAGTAVDLAGMAEVTRTAKMCHCPLSQAPLPPVSLRLWLLWLLWLRLLLLLLWWWWWW